MNEYNSFLNGHRVKKLHYQLLFAVAFLSAILVFIFFSLQPPIYNSSGRFAVFYKDGSGDLTSNLQTNPDLTKSIAETVKSRYFLEKISRASDVEFNENDLNNLDKIVNASVISNSNIVLIEFFNKNTSALDKINKVFLDELNSSKLISSTNSSITVQTIDPLFTSANSSYPKPLTNALATFAVIVFAGLLLIYSISDRS
ncbi:MAG: hypothetical protein WCG99_02945 [Candidatus Berkelbacteria bacterium]